MATTPDEWLPVLTKRLDDAVPQIRLLRDYANGRAPLPEMGDNVRASWIAFQKKARTDYGGLAVASLADRIRISGVQVGDDVESDASRAARRIMRDNRMATQVPQAIVDCLVTRRGYLVTGAGPDGRAVVSREAPEQFYAATDPVRPWKARAAVKVWRDIDTGRDYALVWVPGERQRYSRSSAMETATGSTLIRRNQGDWQRDGEPEVYDGDPPVTVLDREVAVLEPHLDVIDRINLGKLNRLVVVAMQAFRQRALRTATGTAGLPDKDENGNPLNWEKEFAPAPGALWDLPEGIDIWESQTTDIIPLLEGEKADARDFAAVTRTPISVFIPDGANQSAEGAAQATAGQVTQAETDIARIKPAIEVALVYALRVEGVDLGDETVEVAFVPPAHVSLSEKYAAAAQAKAAGLPVKTIMRTVLGMSPEQIAQADLDLAEEQLSAATLLAAAPAPTPAVTGGSAVA